MREYSKIIAVDFDGCLVKNEFPEIGEKNEEVIEKLREEVRNGAVTILWTCRDNEYLENAKAFCTENNIPIDYYNANVPWLDFETSAKIYADEYWDDRGWNPLGSINRR